MIHPTHVELVDTSGKTKPFVIDFNGPALTYRRLHGGGLGQAVCRAIGIKHNHKPTVIDATAGLGRDGFILAAMGCSVTLFERNPILQILLADGLKRGLKNEKSRPICECMQFTPQDIQTCTERLEADVLYIDPMYPHRKKSSLVKKEMRIIRQLVGDDPDADELLFFALQTGIKRVVVKRPKNAPYLGNKKPTHSLKEKNSRFDIYLQP
jgi:16S rRNA (guanine1516-N2)-methyltransferase